MKNQSKDSINWSWRQFSSLVLWKLALKNQTLKKVLYKSIHTYVVLYKSIHTYVVLYKSIHTYVVLYKSIYTYVVKHLIPNWNVGNVSGRRERNDMVRYSSIYPQNESIHATNLVSGRSLSQR